MLRRFWGISQLFLLQCNSSNSLKNWKILIFGYTVLKYVWHTFKINKKHLLKILPVIEGWKTRTFSLLPSIVTEIKSFNFQGVKEILSPSASWLLRNSHKCNKILIIMKSPKKNAQNSMMKKSYEIARHKIVIKFLITTIATKGILWFLWGSCLRATGHIHTLVYV